MNQGYMVGASSVLTSMYRQDVAANNLANIETAGFKPDMTFTIPRAAARQEDGLGNLPSNALLERLGAGVLLGRNRVSFAQGAVTKTGNPLDLAIEGEGFLQLAAPGGSGKNTQVRLTRDGRLAINNEGRLVNASSGLEVLDSADRPITLNRAQAVEIDEAGGIMQGGSKVADLKFVDVPSRDALTKVGDGMFAVSANGISSQNTPSGRIVQRAIERSATDPIKAMMAVQAAANDVSTATRIMQINDDLTGRAINTLGRISA